MYNVHAVMTVDREGLDTAKLYMYLYVVVHDMVPYMYMYGTCTPHVRMHLRPCIFLTSAVGLKVRVVD